MASPQASQSILARNKITPYVFNPDGTDKVDIAWVDMRDYNRLAVVFLRTIGTGNLDTFDIIANSASDGSGTDVIIKTHAIGSQPDAAGDYLVLELSAEELAQEGADAGETLRYVSAQCEFATGTDEGSVIYILEAKHPTLDLTADTVA